MYHEHRRFPLIINGTDYSKKANWHGFHYSWEERTGNNGGTSKGGATIRDLYGHALVVTIDLNCLSDADAAQLLQECSERYITAAVYDPRARTVRETQFVASLPSFDFAMYDGADYLPPYGIGSIWFKDGSQLVLTERKPYEYET